MSTIAKGKARILSIPSDYIYDEARHLLLQLGFKEFQKGKTSGSRVKFYREKDKKIILLHKPHPTNVMSIPSVKDLVKALQDSKDL